MKIDAKRYDVAISDEFPVAAQACAHMISLSGLSAVILPRADIADSNHPAYVIVSDHSAAEDIHVVRIDADTEEAGQLAAYEVLAELFDDSEPGDEI